MLSRLVINSQMRSICYLGKHACSGGRLGLKVVKAVEPIKSSNFNNTLRTYARARLRRPLRRSGLTAENEEAAENAFTMGKGAIAGASGVGLGALCYYGLGLGEGSSIYDHTMFWPQLVRDRIHATYGYFGASCILSALTALAVLRSPQLMNLVTRSSFMATLGSMALVVGSGALAQSLEYTENVGPKHLAWALHCAILGAVMAPMCMLGGPVISRAALYTMGVAGGLSTVAVCAPSDKFLYIGGPLAIGLGLVFVSSLASIWLPPTTLAGASLASFSLYGGLILFGGFLLYDTQRVVRKAERHPKYAATPFDPIGCALAIYMDVLNIFVRIATILATNGGNNSGSKRR